MTLRTRTVMAALCGGALLARAAPATVSRSTV